LSNESLLKQIGGNHKIILTTTANCDCGSIVGLNQHSSLSRLNIENETRKLTKKKWTQSKIDRYISDKMMQQSKIHNRTETVGEREENKWITLAENLTKQNIKFGIMFHQSRGLMEEETIEIKEITQKTLEQLKQGELRNFFENILHWIEK
jgi:hypothetical protein